MTRPSLNARTSRLNQVNFFVKVWARKEAINAVAAAATSRHCLSRSWGAFFQSPTGTSYRRRRFLYTHNCINVNCVVIAISLFPNRSIEWVFLHFFSFSCAILTTTTFSDREHGDMLGAVNAGRLYLQGAKVFSISCKSSYYLFLSFGSACVQRGVHLRALFLARGCYQ